MTKNTSKNTNELPNGWEWKTVGEIADLVTKGSSPKWQGVDYTEKGENSILFITSENVGAYEILTKNLKYVEEEFNKIEPRSILNKGDILMNIVGASIGRTAIYNLDEVANINQAVCLIRLNEKLINKMFALHFFNSSMCIELMFDKQVDNARANLSMGHIKDFEIPLPPLKEQERIVQKLDTAFQSLDEAITLQKENIAHTQELKKAVLVEQISNLACEMKKLGEVVIFNPSKSEVKDLDDCKVSFVPMADMNEREMYFDTKQTKLLSEVYKGYTYFREDDILLAKVTPCFENGKSGIARNLTNKIGFGSSEYFVFRAKQVTTPQFIYYIISSNDFLVIGANNVSGAVGLKRVTKDFIENYKIPLPPLPEQERIVAYLDTSFAKLDALIVEQEARLAQIMELKKSVLQEAFEGKL